MAKAKANGKDAQIIVRVEPRIKELADELFTSLGINMSTAINVFLRQCIRDGKIPFEIDAHTTNYSFNKKEEFCNPVDFSFMEQRRQMQEKK